MSGNFTKFGGGRVKIEWLEALRLGKHYTQAQLAEMVNISRVHYTNIENGERRPSPEIAKAIAAILGFKWYDFFPDPPPNLE